MTNPDSVSLVNPPKTMMPKTLAALPSNQYAIIFSLVLGKRDLAASFSGLLADANDADFRTGPSLVFHCEPLERDLNPIALEIDEISNGLLARI